MTMGRSSKWRSGGAIAGPADNPWAQYSLFYGRPGIREVGYDNERGKGDHRHYKGAETPYAYSTVEQLMIDFWSDVLALRGGK
jgi:hypothetical protein